MKYGTQRFPQVVGMHPTGGGPASATGAAQARALHTRLWLAQSWQAAPPIPQALASPPAAQRPFAVQHPSQDAELQLGASGAASPPPASLVPWPASTPASL